MYVHVCPSSSIGGLTRPTPYPDPAGSRYHALLGPFRLLPIWRFAPVVERPSTARLQHLWHSSSLSDKFVVPPGLRDCQAIYSACALSPTQPLFAGLSATDAMSHKPPAAANAERNEGVAREGAGTTRHTRGRTWRHRHGRDEHTLGPV